ncbi:octopine dehydrogenase [Plasmopara halstedii]|uniref:Octopine dehydrogenase n=1 Tax=Plasmopara halstedii TaxID=4781 RepID=A0A0P1B7K0_PLAHL|nr:octopine dehydrogenase [Plasmopara halstedii]CEG50121.1 octopine dehydrogenase [Plasmopara halstedii]|eukprot:XP_024586490.1 octopine dehydrogenase [Plasmopara halstedii]
MASTCTESKQNISSAPTVGIVTICGGGNGAHVAATYLSAKGVRVQVLTRQPERWAEVLELSTAGSSWESKGVLTGRLSLVSRHAKHVIPQSDVVIVASPANAHPTILKHVAPFLTKGVKLGALFAQGGFDWAVKKALGEEILSNVDLLFGLQNIPWICKATQYGQKCRIIGPKKCLYVACYPVERTGDAATLMQMLYDIPCKPLANFLNLTLTPSNQIIHPARYYAIFRDWDGKKTYALEELKKRDGLTLYADFDEFSAEQLTMLDNELQQIKYALLQRFPALDLSDVLPMGDRVVKHYGEDVSDRSSLLQIFRTNRGYAGCATPLTELSKGQYQPAVNSRLFWEDIPFGLCILKNIAEMLGNFPTPRIDFMIRWHQQFMGVEFLSPDGQLNARELWRTGAPNKYGVHTLEDLVSTSLPNEMRNYRHPRSRI